MTSARHTLRLLGFAAVVAAVALSTSPRALNADSPFAALAQTASTLPTGTSITPAGTQVGAVGGQEIGLLPQETALSPSGRWMAISSPGNDTKTVSFFDLQAGKVVQTLNLNRPSFTGIVFSDEDTVFVSGGSANDVLVLKRGAGGSFAISDPPIPVGAFPAGMELDPSRHFLYVANDFANSISVISVATRTVLGTVPAGDHPYGVLVTGDSLFVSNWGDATVMAYQLVAGVPVPKAAGRLASIGSHPSALAFDAGRHLLLVSNGNEDTVSAVDVMTMTERARVRVAPALGARSSNPPSAAPGAVVIDGSHAFVANGGDNTIAVLDLDRVAAHSDSAVIGYVPAGWYPSALRVVSGELFYANAKGNGPDSTSAGGNGVLFQGRGTPPSGTLWHLPVTTALTQLASFTRQVAADNKWKTLPGNVSARGTPLSHIKHVVYVLRENKTFDEEFSDVPGANGQQCQTPGQVATWHASSRTYTCPDGKDPLLVYGRQVTPNSHALASRYALLNNFDVDVETSIIGHQWANASQLSDFAQRTYGNTEGWTSQEPGFVPQNGVTDIAYPQRGYIFDAILRAGHTARGYSGGYDTADVSGRPANVSKIVDNTDLLVPIGLDSGLYPDTLRVREFERDVTSNGLADFSFVWLADDHTVGGLPGNLTPQSQVATNDIATGQLVDFLSHSSYWKDTAVFIIEDDPQSGRDHVSGYRSIFMVASPWAKRHVATGQRYDMSSLLRTFELIFDAQPLSRNDLEVAPLTSLFTDQPDLTPYTWLTPEVPPTLNPPNGPFSAPTRGIDLRKIDPEDGGALTRLLQRMARGDAGEPVRGAGGLSVADQWQRVIDAGTGYASLFG